MPWLLWVALCRAQSLVTRDGQDNCEACAQTRTCVLRPLRGLTYVLLLQTILCHSFLRTSLCTEREKLASMESPPLKGTVRATIFNKTGSSIGSLTRHLLLHEPSSGFHAYLLCLRMSGHRETRPESKIGGKRIRCINSYASMQQSTLSLRVAVG